MLVIESSDHTLHCPVEPHLFAGQPLAPREIPARAEVILAELHARGLVEGGSPVTPPPVSDELLGRVHGAEYLEFLATAHDRWRELTGGGEDGEALPFVRPMLDQPHTTSDHVLAQMGRYSNDADPILAGTWAAARSSAAAAAGAADAVAGGRRAAYALTRPPGHHAAPNTFGGYCYLNNVAIAAEVLVAGGARVATLDVDTHAGNGTQAVFWDRSDVLCVSLHVDPAVEYPYYQGHAHEVGAGDGEGFTRNLPMAPRRTWDGYDEVLDAACRTVVDHGADVVVVALGVDTASEDGVMDLGGDDYRRLGTRLAAMGLPCVFIQEGGYDLGVLGVNVASTLEGFEDAS